ncbi:MAG: SpoIIE family protein phosphatase [Bacteroidota bacterium]
MLTRIVIGTLAAALFAAALVTFYDFAGSPTDENLFSDLPGHLAFKHAQPSLAAEWNEMTSKSMQSAQTHSDNVRKGDLLITLNNKSVSGLSRLNEIFSAVGKDSLASAYLLRPSQRWLAKVRLSRSDIPDSLFEEIPRGALVIGVTPGGASDLAGMLVGDIIVRINGKEFANAQAGDVLLRRAQSGHPIVYNVLRDLQPLPLTVTLARFGFPLSSLTFSLSGLLFLAVGSFIALKRPELLPARLLGLGYILTGFAVAVVGNRREPVVDLFVALRWIALVFAIFFGAAVSWHASLRFPSENTEILRRPWLIRFEYIIGLLLSALMIVLGARGEAQGNLELFLFAAGVVLIILYGSIVRLVYRYHPDPVSRARHGIIKYTSIGVGIVSTALLVYFVFSNHFDLWGFVGIPLILLPLSTLYTIGRYRLLDMNLRVRRTIQYVLSSIFWGMLVVSLGVTLLTVVLSMPMNFPSVSIHGTSIEIRDAAVFAGQANGTERLVFVGLGLLAWVGISKVRKFGQGAINHYFDRAQYDYRRALAEISSVLSTTLSMSALGSGIVTKLVDLMKLRRAGVFFFKDEKVCCCREAHGIAETRWADFCREKEGLLALAAGKFSGPVTSDLLPPAVSEDFRTNEFPHVIPVRSKDKLIAVLVLGEKLSEAPYTAEDIDFLMSVALQSSVAIENAFLYEELAEQERLKHELEIARRIQLASLPQETPVINGLDISGRSVPALEVGGDFFDYLLGTGGDITVVIGDVSGKGTSAALYMSKVQGVLRSLHSFIQSPSELFVRANQLLREGMERSSYVTAMGVKFQPAGCTITVSRAGHLPLYVFDAGNGKLRQILPKGLGLGLDPGEKFAHELEEFTATYHRNDLFILLTDGITEARNLQGEEISPQLLEQVIRNHSSESAEHVRDSILDAVREFAGRAPQHDDQTIVVVRVTG